MKALALLGLLFAAPFFLTSSDRPDSRWLTDLDAAHQLARETGQPLLLAFR